MISSSTISLLHHAKHCLLLRGKTNNLSFQEDKCELPITEVEFMWMYLFDAMDLGNKDEGLSYVFGILFILVIKPVVVQFGRMTTRKIILRKA